MPASFQNPQRTPKGFFDHAEAIRRCQVLLLADCVDKLSLVKAAVR
jgi:hypothetical protein